MMLLDEAIDAFLTHCRVERGLSPNTITAYARDIQAFQSWSKTTKLSDLAPGRFTAYISELNTRGDYSPATIRRRIAALRRFSRYLLIRNLLDKDVFPRRLKAPRAIPLPHAITYDEIRRLLASPDTQTQLGIRDRALLETLYASGMRVSECCNLQLPNLDLNAGFARVHGKGGKVRICPLGDFAVEWLDRYLSDVRPKLPVSQRSTKVFLSRRGELSRVQVFRLVRKYAAGAGIAARVTPHTLRHSFATHLLENGADIRVVQELLGHSRISTVEFYTRVLMSRLRQIYSKAHPHG